MVVQAIAVDTFTCDLCRREIRRGEWYVRELHGLGPKEPLRRYRAHYSCWLTKPGATLAESVAALYPDLGGRTPEEARGFPAPDDVSRQSAEFREALRAARQGDFEAVPEDPELWVHLWMELTAPEASGRYPAAVAWLGRRLAETDLIRRYTLELADGTVVATDDVSEHRARRRAARWLRVNRRIWRRPAVRRMVDLSPPRDPPSPDVELVMEPLAPRGAGERHALG